MSEQIRYWAMPIPPVPGETYTIAATPEFLKLIHVGLEHPAVLQDVAQWPVKSVGWGMGKILSIDKDAETFTALFTPHEKGEENE